MENFIFWAVIFYQTLEDRKNKLATKSEFLNFLMITFISNFDICMFVSFSFAFFRVRGRGNLIGWSNISPNKFAAHAWETIRSFLGIKLNAIVSYK